MPQSFLNQFQVAGSFVFAPQLLLQVAVMVDRQRCIRDCSACQGPDAACGFLMNCSPEPDAFIVAEQPADVVRHIFPAGSLPYIVDKRQEIAVHMRCTEQLIQNVGRPAAHGFVGVKNQNPGTGGLPQYQIAGKGEIPLPGNFEHLCPEAQGNLHTVVRRSCVGNNDFRHQTCNRGQAALQMLCFILDNHAQR
ncbi:hypothetical protein D3C73_830540 [compost metagenome]